jgi:hypothetical protein
MTMDDGMGHMMDRVFDESNGWMILILGGIAFIVIIVAILYVLNGGLSSYKERTENREISDKKFSSKNSIEHTTQPFCPTCGEKLGNRTQNFCPFCGGTL